MNAYFDNFTNTGYNDVSLPREIPERRLGDGIINLICAIVSIVTCPAAVMLEKAAAVFVLFLSALAVVGAIEGGLMPMFIGIIICAVISLCEYGILKSFWRSKHNKA